MTNMNPDRITPHEQLIKSSQRMRWQLNASSVVMLVMTGLMLFGMTRVEPHRKIVLHQCGTYNEISGDFKWKYEELNQDEINNPAGG